MLNYKSNQYTYYIYIQQIIVSVVKKTLIRTQVDYVLWVYTSYTTKYGLVTIIFIHFLYIFVKRVCDFLLLFPYIRFKCVHCTVCRVYYVEYREFVQYLFFCYNRHSPMWEPKICYQYILLITDSGLWYTFNIKIFLQNRLIPVFFSEFQLLTFQLKAEIFTPP